uniref:Uncharacterized protein MANES_10G129800 n=1 Tax=Rhizophora mucronata TaxID=61149 RepID=A0A2P2KTL8_RHIMU
MAFGGATANAESGPYAHQSLHHRLFFFVFTSLGCLPSSVLQLQETLLSISCA